jgi:pimeloyl-ACP methyl ester carboxylesterase
MPVLKRDDGEIYYEVHGKGYPVFCLAPGWLGSSIPMWPLRPEKPYPWADWPKALKDRYQVITMDQRNAGQSRTAIEADHGWHTYAADQKALVDHLGLKRFHIVGICIGSSFALRLCEMMPERISATVLPQPIGLEPAHPRNFPDRYEKWMQTKLAERPELDAAKLRAFGHNMWDGDFVYSVTRDSVRNCRVPGIVMPGSNVSHPPATGREVAELLPTSELVTEWECPAFEAQQLGRGMDFLARHTPQ